MENKELSKIIERIERIEKAVFRSESAKKQKLKGGIISNKDVNFSLNERAFIKRYAAGKSGSKKFTILLAYLASGKVDKDIKLNDIRTRWNKMSAKDMLGKFNMFFPSDAKTRGWVDSKKYGSYCLTNEWEEVL